MASHTFINFRLYFLDLGFRFDINGYRINPVDYQATWDLDNKEEYCHSVSVNHSVFDFDLKIDVRVYECFFGLLGVSVPG